MSSVKDIKGNQAICVARLPNAGLGNRLFPWARSVVYAELHGLRRMQPQWWNIRLGPIFRGEKDWRWYFGQFKTNPSELHGILRRIQLSLITKVNEPTSLNLPPQSNCRVIEFAAGQRYFDELNPHFELIKRTLLASLTDRWRLIESRNKKIRIGIHVRRGDFMATAEGANTSGMNNVQTPLNWFIETLQRIRASLGLNIPAFVVSDGNDQELAGLLSLPQVVREQNGSAIGDMLGLSKATVLLCAGESTFSFWSAFLGQMPALFPPGHGPERYFFRNEMNAPCCVFNPSASEQILLQRLMPYFEPSIVNEQPLPILR